MDQAGQLRVLGDLSLSGGSSARSVGGPKSQHLVAMLVACRGESLSTERVVEAMWDAPPRTATATVQTHISRLRSVLRPDFSITFSTAGYRLESDGGVFDVAQFETLLASARNLDDARSLDIVQRALDLWRGPAFAGFADHEPVRAEAIRLEELRLVATDLWAEARLNVDDPALVVSDLESLVAKHPLRDAYWRLLMLGLYRCGRQTEALRRAGELRALLQDVGLDVSPTIRDLEAKILTDDLELLSASATVARRSPSATTARILLGPTEFVGREREVTSLAAATADHGLITVTGPGGVGKTRLARWVAAQILDRFPDGVTTVEFAALRDPAGVVPLIGHALDIQAYQFQTLETTIEGHLSSARSLLVLDNCEHVIDTVAPFVDRLRSSCPHLRILATSREPLGLPGEYVHVLDPLGLPAGRATVNQIRSSPAVRLFAIRASTAAPGFAVTADNAEMVAGICRSLDGLPLALELATARLRSMGLAALATRLNQPEFLAGQTQRGSDKRQRTLHDLVSWSYDLLSPAEQQVFSHLAVFAGGFDLDAAEAVCRPVDRDRSVVDHVASLADKSMVVLVDRDRSRYRVLEPLREFGLDRLRDAADLHAAEDRHLHWFLDRAAIGASELDGPDEGTWSRSLAVDFDNFRAAHLTSLDRRDLPAALRLVTDLGEFAMRSVRYEVADWAATARALDDDAHGPAYATAIALSAYGLFVRGDMDAAIALAESALAAEAPPAAAVAASKEPLPSTSGLAERVLGNAHFYLEHVDEALRWMDQMERSARRCGSKARLAHALYMRSVARTSLGDRIQGALLAGEATEAATSAGSPTALAQAGYARGLALESVDHQAALGHFEQASRHASDAGNRWVEAFALTEVYGLRARSGDPLHALRGYANVVDIWHRGGDWANQWLSLRKVLGILIDLGDLETATVLHGALGAVGASHAMPFEPVDAARLSENVALLRSHLGAAEFAERVRRGAAMRDNEIVAFVKQDIARRCALPTGAG